MSPYEPGTDEAFVIAPLAADLPAATGPGESGKCDFCGRRVWLNPTTLEFMSKHEVPPICTDCAKGLVKKESK